MSNIINNLYLEKQRSGLSFPVTKITSREDNPEEYVFAHDYRLRHAWNDAAEAKSVRQFRMRVAVPRIMGYLENIKDGPDIVASGITIKPPRANKIGLPHCYAFAAGMAQFVANDVAALYASEDFNRCEISLVTQRTNIPKGEAHRPIFSDWHDHLTEPGEIDLVYTFSTILPTEFKSIGPTHENSLTRFGAEIKHRSQTNNLEDNRRLWGAFIISANPSEKTLREKRAVNVAFANGVDILNPPELNTFQPINPVNLSR